METNVKLNVRKKQQQHGGRSMDQRPQAITPETLILNAGKHPLPDDDTGNRIREFFADDANYKKVLSMCIKVCRHTEDAEDMRHDIFMHLLSKAEGINFPEDNGEALAYVHCAIANLKHQQHRKSLAAPEMVDLSEAEVQEDISDIACMRKLERLDELISQSGLFTADQLKLWKCLFKFMDKNKIADSLGKSTAAVSKLKFKLFIKICNNFRLEDLNASE